MAFRPPCFLSHLNTRPAKYQPKVGGVLSMEPSSAMALKSHTAGVPGRALPMRSSRTITTQMPDGPMFFCAPA